MTQPEKQKEPININKLAIKQIPKWILAILGTIVMLQLMNIKIVDTANSLLDSLVDRVENADFSSRLDSLEIKVNELKSKE